MLLNLYLERLRVVQPVAGGISLLQFSQTRQRIIAPSLFVLRISAPVQRSVRAAAFVLDYAVKFLDRTIVLFAIQVGLSLVVIALIAILLLAGVARDIPGASRFLARCVARRILKGQEPNIGEVGGERWEIRERGHRRQRR